MTPHDPESLNALSKVIAPFKDEKIRMRLECGNCGMFAYALARYLLDVVECPKQVELALVLDSGYKSKDLLGLLNEDGVVYHVALRADGYRYFDGNGEISEAELVGCGVRWYNDHEANLLMVPVTDEENDLLLIRSIEFNTSWSCPWVLFYNVMRGIDGAEVVFDCIENSKAYLYRAVSSVE